MPKTSAGILFYKFHSNTLEILLVHPGGHKGFLNELPAIIQNKTATKA